MLPLSVVMSCISCDMIVCEIAPIYMREAHGHIPRAYEVVRLYGLLCTLLSGFIVEGSELFCKLNALQLIPSRFHVFMLS